MTERVSLDDDSGTDEADGGTALVTETGGAIDKDAVDE
jgi:hypothetical protein